MTDTIMSKIASGVMLTGPEMATVRAALSVPVSQEVVAYASQLDINFVRRRAVTHARLGRDPCDGYDVALYLAPPSTPVPPAVHPYEETPYFGLCEQCGKIKEDPVHEAVPPVEADELVELIERRIGDEFDGECHLTDAEARQVVQALHSRQEPKGWQPPDGWKLVPVEPTPDMLSQVGTMEGWTAENAASGAYACHVDWWKSMLAAAPSPNPSTSKQGG